MEYTVRFWNANDTVCYRTFETRADALYFIEVDIPNTGSVLMGIEATKTVKFTVFIDEKELNDYYAIEAKLDHLMGN